MKYLILIILFAGCASIHKSIELLQDPSSRVVVPQTPPLYIRATTNLEHEKFNEAKAEYEQFLIEQPTTPYTQVANFNLGRALLGLDLISEATEKFRFVAAQTTGHAPQLQAQALYELSFCYEASGDKVNALASLLDSLQRKQYFSKEMAEAEIPARLAGAYAITGNFETAQIYYSQAENGIRQLKRENQNRNVPDWLPRTLYYMGDVSLRKISFGDVANILKPLSKAQLYLLEAAELGKSSWSQKASSELTKTYASTFEVIAKPRESSDLAVARESQEKQWSLAQEFFKVLDEMKTYERPDVESQNTLTKDIFKSVNDTKSKLNNLLNEPRIGQDITDDSRTRQIMRKHTKVAPPKTAKPAPSAEDPNL